MRRFFLWVAVNADALIALTLAVLVSLLDVAGLTSNAVLSNATVVTLGVLAFAILHDRRTNEGTRIAIHRIHEETRTAIQRSHQDTRTAIESLGLKIDETNSLRILTGPDISKAILQAQENTDKWLFRGSTATYVRSVVMPRCLDRAKQSRRGFQLRLEILDPRSEQVCDSYVRLYRDLAADDSGPEHGWTVKGTQIELYATIMAVCWYANRSLDFVAEIALTNLASSFRWEASSKWFMLTQRGPHYPAFLISNEDPLYGLFIGELNGSFRQASQIPVKEASKVLVNDEPTINEVRSLFSRLGITPPESFTDDDFDEIIAKALHDENPYV